MEATSRGIYLIKMYLKIPQSVTMHRDTTWESIKQLYSTPLSLLDAIV